MEFRSAGLALFFMVATGTFLACVAVALVRWRFSVRTLLIATTAACISLATLAAR